MKFGTLVALIEGARRRAPRRGGPVDRDPDTAGRNDRDADPESQPQPQPDAEPEPSKGAGRKSNVQRAPEDQRARPDPKYEN